VSASAVIRRAGLGWRASLSYTFVHLRALLRGGDGDGAEVVLLDLEDVLVDRDGGDAELLRNLGDRGVLVLVELVLHNNTENLALSLREAPQLFRRYHVPSKPGHEI